jgi:hypothetical protein
VFGEFKLRKTSQPSGHNSASWRLYDGEGFLFNCKIAPAIFLFPHNSFGNKVVRNYGMVVSSTGQSSSYPSCLSAKLRLQFYDAPF